MSATETFRSTIEVLRTAVESGRTALFELRDPACEEALRSTGILQMKPRVVLPATALRELLTSVDARNDPSGLASVKIPSAGVRICGVTIEGDLDLNDISGAGGVLLPRLEFSKCWFTGRVLLERSRLTSLALVSCRFAELQASEAVIDGPVDITYARSSMEPTEQAPEPLCWVVLAGAQIGGRINARCSHFAAPPLRKSTVWVLNSRYARYALDLRAASIRASVTLRPDFSAYGGVCLTLTRLAGSVWANGACLTAGEDAAFEANYAEIQGSLYFRPFELLDEAEPDHQAASPEEQGKPVRSVAKNRPFTAYGAISIFAAKIGGSVYCEGARLLSRISGGQTVGVGKDGRATPLIDDPFSFDAANAVIGGNCLLSCWESSDGLQSKLYKFRADEKVNLNSTVVRNHLTFNGAYLISLFAENIEVQGTCSLSVYVRTKPPEQVPFRATTTVVFDRGRIRGDFRMDGAKIGQHPWSEAYPDRSVQNELLNSVADGARCDPVDASRQLIVREMLTALFDESRKHYVEYSAFDRRMIVLSAKSLDVGGNCTLGTFGEREHYEIGKNDPNALPCLECLGQIDMQEANIGNSLRMDGAMIVGVAEPIGNTVDLSGICVGGKATFRVWDMKPPNESDDALHPDSGYRFLLWGGGHALKLSGAKIGQELELNGAYIGAKAGSAIVGNNMNIGGKASFNIYEDKQHHLYKAIAIGKVSFASSSIALGLRFTGARLLRYPIQGDAPSQAFIVPSMGNKVAASHLPILLDLTQIRTRLLSLQGFKHCLKDVIQCNSADDFTMHDFEVQGETLLVHADIATDVNVSYAHFSGALKADFAKVGGAIRLAQSWFACTPRAAELVFKDLLDQHLQRSLNADLSLYEVRVGGALEVRGTQLDSQCTELKWKSKLRPHFVADLRGAQLGELDDLGGEGWGGDLRLWLDGLRYARLTEMRYSNPSGENENIRFSLLSNIRGWNPRRWINPSYTDPPEDSHSAVKADKEHLRSSRAYLWKYRTYWLGRQYLAAWKPSKSEFTPDAYEQVVLGLNSSGSFDDARRIASMRLTDEHLSDGSRRTPRVFWFLFRMFLDFGFSIKRAIVTFAFCLLAGWIAVAIANDGLRIPLTPHHSFVIAGVNALTITMGQPATQISPQNATDGELLHFHRERTGDQMKDQTGKAGMFAVLHQTDEPVSSIRCGNLIEPPLYALDVFVPVLDLRQQTVCSVGPGHKWWHYGLAAYALLGWILTPLVILTCTGLLRRHLEL